LTATPGTYSITVKGETEEAEGWEKKTSSATLTLNVQAKPYNITFTQSGLPAGTLWSVTFNRTTKSSTDSTITFENVTYGTYE